MTESQRFPWVAVWLDWFGSPHRLHQEEGKHYCGTSARKVGLKSYNVAQGGCLSAVDQKGIMPVSIFGP